MNAEKPNMDYVVMSVHFLRNNNEREDDYIQVQKQESSSNFCVDSTLCTNHPSSRRLQTTTIMSAHGITRFFQDVFALVALDSIPFQSVQFNSPLVPSVVFDLSSGAFDKARDTIVRLVDTTILNWPRCITVELGAKRRRVQ